MYLYRQYASVYGQKCFEENVENNFFVSEYATKEEAVKWELDEMKKDADEHGYNFDDSVYDRGGLEDNKDDCHCRGLDGYARVMHHIDGIRLVGEVTEEEVAVLTKFGAI